MVAKQGGLVANVVRSQNFHPAGGYKSAKCFVLRPKNFVAKQGGLVARITTDDIQKVFEPRPPRDPLREIYTIFWGFLYQGQKSPELVCQASSHNFLSVIFGILGKFWIDIGVQNIIEIF